MRLNIKINVMQFFIFIAGAIFPIYLGSTVIILRYVLRISMPCVGSCTVQSLANVKQMRTSINGFGRYSNLLLFLTIHPWLAVTGAYMYMYVHTDGWYC